MANGVGFLVIRYKIKSEKGKRHFTLAMRLTANIN